MQRGFNWSDCCNSMNCIMSLDHSVLGFSLCQKTSQPAAAFWKMVDYAGQTQSLKPAKWKVNEGIMEMIGNLMITSKPNVRVY